MGISLGKNRNLQSLKLIACGLDQGDNLSYLLTGAKALPAFGTETKKAQHTYLSETPKPATNSEY
jgi:hypothetical protein